PSADALAKMAEFINGVKRPLIYFGGGIIAANASKELLELMQKLNSPVTCSLMGLGSIPADNKQFVGTIGMHGDIRSALALKTCDSLIAIGARFSDRVAGDRKKFAQNIKVAHIDIDRAEINKNVRVDVSLVADAKVALKRLLPLIDKKDNSDWLNEINERAAKTCVAPSKHDPNPRYIIELIRKYTPKNQIVATDVGQHQMWTGQYFKFSYPRTFISSCGLGTMGYGLGAANGAAIGTGRKTVLITGDGSFHMNMSEVATACKYNLPVVIFVMNNRALGMVRQWQTLFFSKRYSQTNVEQRTDFVKLAEAFGAKGYRIEKNADAPAIIKEALRQDTPVIVDCVIDTDEFVLPMIPAGKTVDDIITNPNLN
ncbi:MAG: thiamine pyrophosphate-dependent enzyme, partial [Christensenellales bacterium]